MYTKVLTLNLKREPDAYQVSAPEKCNARSRLSRASCRGSRALEVRFCAFHMQVLLLCCCVLVDCKILEQLS